MAFYGLLDNEEESIELPWFNEYLETIGEDIERETFDVITVKPTPKGFILSTEFFNAWVWRKTPLGEHLKATLTTATQSDTHPQLSIVVNRKVKTKFSVGLRDDVSCCFLWIDESKIYTLHPQKNLPLDLPPEANNSNELQSPSGNTRKLSSVPAKASQTSSKVQSSQTIAS